MIARWRETNQRHHPVQIWLMIMLLLLPCHFTLAASRRSTTIRLSTTTKSLIVTQRDIAAAGFGRIKIIPPWKNLFLPPNQYFDVDAGRHLTVFIRPMPDLAWSYHQGAIETLSFGGVWQVRGSRPGFYIVVTGADKTKITKLMERLRTKKL